MVRRYSAFADKAMKKIAVLLREIDSSTYLLWEDNSSMWWKWFANFHAVLFVPHVCIGVALVSFEVAQP